MNGTPNACEALSVKETAHTQSCHFSFPHPYTISKSRKEVIVLEVALSLQHRETLERKQSCAESVSEAIREQNMGCRIRGSELNSEDIK